MARRGAASASPTSRTRGWLIRTPRPAGVLRLRPCPMRNCTVTRTSRSSTGPRIPRNSWRRPYASGWRHWRSPIITVSTAWCALRRQHGPRACPRCSALRSRSLRVWTDTVGSPRTRQQPSARSPGVQHPLLRSPTPMVNTSCSLLTVPRAIHGCRAHSASVTSPARRGHRAARSRISPTRALVTGGCLRGAARVWCPGHS